jgi:hypothetical protein
MARRRFQPEGHKKGQMVQELCRDLSRKYQIHRPKIEEIWRSFDAHQRAKAFKAGAYQSRVLKDPTDRSLGDPKKIKTQLKIRDNAV